MRRVLGSSATVILWLAIGVLGCKESTPTGDGGSGGTAGVGGAGAGGIGGAGGSALPFAGSVTNLDDAIEKADFVFEGEVMSVVYANSMNNGTGGPDPDDADDPGALPHTFVTFQIVEDFSGNAAGDTVTMRFIGGVDETTGPDYDILELAQAPRFDVGDRDIILMRGNTELACPMVGCADFRFRMLTSARDDRPYVFSELAQEIRLVEDSRDEAHLFMVGEHLIAEIFEHTLEFPDGNSAVLRFTTVAEPGEVDPITASLQQKHNTEPRPDGNAPLDEPSEEFGAPVAGTRLEPAQLRALIRKSIADHPDFAWLPYANADPSVPFTIAMFDDDPGPPNDDDPRVNPPPREPYEEAEAGAVEAADIENDGSIDPAVAFDIRSRRETATGVVETPNREDSVSAEEDMWTEAGQ